MSDPKGPKADAGLRAAILTVGLAAVALTVAAALLFDASVATGVGLGGVLATSNLLLFARLGQAFLAQGGMGRPWMALAVLKLFGLFVAMFLLLRHTDLSALALLVGYGALPIGIVLAGLFGPKPPDDADLSAPPDDAPRRRPARPVEPAERGASAGDDDPAG
jgi:hypothetical protein